MKKVTVRVVLLCAALFGLISCATGVTTEEFQTYQAEQDRVIARIESKISYLQTLEESTDQLSQKIDILKQKFDLAASSLEGLETDTVADQGKVTELKQHVEDLSAESTQVYEALAELVRFAGYDSADQFLQIAHDIVDANKNIERINERLEQLRRAMAIFVDE